MAIFEVDSWPTNVSNAVSSILANPNMIPGLSVLSVNINTRTYTLPTTTSTTTAAATAADTTTTTTTATKNEDSNNIGLIVGLVVGLVVGLALISIGAGYFIRKHLQTKNGPGTGNVTPAGPQFQSMKLMNSPFSTK